MKSNDLLLTNSIVMAKYDVFISYSSFDQKVVEGICGYLERYDYRCFVAYRDIPAGVSWPAAIPPAIKASTLMVVVFSKDFNATPQTDRELNIASNNNKPILTFKISDAEMTDSKEYFLSDKNWIDAFPEPEKYFGKLKESVERLVGKPMLGNQVDSVPYKRQEVREDRERQRIQEQRIIDEAEKSGTEKMDPVNDKKKREYSFLGKRDLIKNHIRSISLIVIYDILISILAFVSGMLWDLGETFKGWIALSLESLGIIALGVGAYLSIKNFEERLILDEGYLYGEDIDPLSYWILLFLGGGALGIGGFEYSMSEFDLGSACGAWIMFVLSNLLYKSIRIIYIYIIYIVDKIADK